VIGELAAQSRIHRHRVGGEREVLCVGSPVATSHGSTDTGSVGNKKCCAWERL
jgi:hypothetical protein